MKITRQITVEQDVRYLKATMGVRYWENCSYSEDNGQTWEKDFPDNEEISDKIKAITPCVVRKNIGYKESDYLELIIDLEEGKVLNWKKNFCLNTFYKVCDDGEYAFLDENMNEIVNITKEYEQYYVPDFLEIGDEGYGDYVYLEINGDGTINNFDEMKEKIEYYFNHLNED